MIKFLVATKLHLPTTVISQKEIKTPLRRSIRLIAREAKETARDKNDVAETANEYKLKVMNKRSCSDELSKFHFFKCVTVFLVYVYSIIQ